MVVALAAVAAGAALSFAGMRLRNRRKQHQERLYREELLDKTINDTMDASDAVAKY